MNNLWFNIGLVVGIYRSVEMEYHSDSTVCKKSGKKNNRKPGNGLRFMCGLGKVF